MYVSLNVKFISHTDISYGQMGEIKYRVVTKYFICEVQGIQWEQCQTVIKTVLHDINRCYKNSKTKV